MKTNKKTTISDKRINNIIGAITNGEIIFNYGDSIELLCDYMDVECGDLFHKSTLPDRGHIAALIEKNRDFKRNVANLAEQTADDVIKAYAQAEAFDKEVMKDNAKIDKMTKEQKARKAKLLKSFSEEQIETLEEVFNIKAS